MILRGGRVSCFLEKGGAAGLGLYLVGRMGFGFGSPRLPAEDDACRS